VSNVISPSVNSLWRRVVRLLPLFFFLSVSSASATPELILFNARILVADASFSEVEAIAIEQGRICAIGRNYAVKALADDNTRLVDLGGRTVIPGLIDNHMHAIRAAGRWRHEVRLDGVTSYRQALDLIAAKAETLPAGAWITTVGGFVERQFLDQPEGFRLQDLDAAAPDNPVYLQHLFDWGYVNSQALAQIGIDSQQAEQKRPGLLLDDSGYPSGTVTKLTQQAIVAALPDPTAEQYRQSVLAMMQSLNSLGITAILDAGGFDTLPAYYVPFQQLADEGQLSVRVHYLKQLIPWEKGFGYPPDMRRLLDDESPEAMGWFRRIGIGEQVYLPVQDSVGRAAKSSEPVRRAFQDYVTRLAQRGAHLHLHAVNDNSIRQHLDIFDQVARETDLRMLRWTFAHADGVQPDTLQRVRDSGFNIAIHARPWLIGYRFQRQLGEQAAQLSPMKTLSELNVPWGLGSDSPMVASMNPFHTLHWAVNGTMVDGKPLSDQTVSRQQALVAHTRSNARLLFAENLLGTLEPGKRADLVVLDRSYLDIPAAEIRDIQPVATMVDGSWVFGEQQWVIEAQ